MIENDDNLRRDNPRVGFWWSLAGVALPAAVFFIIPELTGELGVLGMGAVWFPTAVVLYVILAAVLGRFKKLVVPRGSRLKVMLLGLLQAVGAVLFFTALDVAEPNLVAFVGNATPLFTVLGSWLIFKERFRGRQLIGGVLIIAGALVITYYDETGSLSGILLMLTACLFFAVHTLLGRHLTRRVDPLALAFWRTCFLMAAFVVAALVSGNLRPPATGELWLLILAGALIGPVGSIFAYYLALSNWGAGKVDLVRSSLSLWVLVWSLILYGRLPAPVQLVGGVLTVVGVSLLLARRRPAAER